jgi:hypothetical protein
MPATVDQIAICARFRSEVVPAEPSLKLGIALATLLLLPLNASRHKQENGTCGWYIYGGDYSSNPDFYQPLRVSHISNYCPTIVAYMALAPGGALFSHPIIKTFGLTRNVSMGKTHNYTQFPYHAPVRS